MTITTDQQTELEKPVTRVAYFAEFQFAGGTSRLSNWNHTLTWGGYDWSGLGALAAISPVEESRGLSSKALTFALNAAQQSWLTLAIGDPQECRGRSAKLYMCPLDEQYRLINTPELCWRGTMNPPVVSISEKGEGQISLRCETSAYGLKRKDSLRMNAAQQRKKYPSDGGFDYLTDLIANPQLWISVRFQRV
jgi:hypothetical protein